MHFNLEFFCKRFYFAFSDGIEIILCEREKLSLWHLWNWVEMSRNEAGERAYNVQSKTSNTAIDRSLMKNLGNKSLSASFFVIDRREAAVVVIVVDDG